MNLVRILVVIYGGFVVGIGTPILWERRRLMRILRFDHSARSATILTFVNIAVLSFIIGVVLARWDEPISWQSIGAFIIFTAKAVMLWEVRLDTIYQGLYRGHPIIERRTSGERRMVDRRQ